MAPSPPLMSVSDYLTKTPYTVKPMELLYGALRVAESPTPRHQSIVADLFRALDAHVRENDLGRMWLAPLDVVLDENRALVLQPDLMFISNSRASFVTDRIWGPPDLVIEVLSPEPRIGRLGERVRCFARHGVQECWLVRQREVSVEILAFEDRRRAGSRVFQRTDAIDSSVLPGFRMSLDDLLL